MNQSYNISSVLSEQHAVSHPRHGGTTKVCYWLIHLEVISPDLWGHWQSKRIAQHHRVCLLHWMT